MKSAIAEDNSNESFAHLKDSIKSKETSLDAGSDETSKLEKAISALASNLNVEISESLLSQIRKKDLENKKLKNHLAKLELVEHKMEDHMQTIQTNIETLQNDLTNDSGSPEKEFRFRDKFKEWQNNRSSAGDANLTPDQDYFQELGEYTLFLKTKILEFESRIKETQKQLRDLQFTSDADQENVSSRVDEYKQQKESLKTLSEKLLTKFQKVVDNARESFEKLQKSIGKYETQLQSKKEELASNTSIYYNLKNISDNKLSRDIERRIEEHLKFLEAAGKLDNPRKRESNWRSRLDWRGESDSEKCA